MNIINKNNAHVFMVILASLFGLNFVWAKFITEAGSAYVVLFFVSIAGFAITSVIVLVMKVNLKVRFRYIFVLNFFLLITYVFELVGLKYTTSSNTSFIVQLSVLMIPILSALADKRRPAARSIVLGLIALVGIAIMTVDPESLSLNFGDMMIMMVALCFSIYIIMVERARDSTVAIVFYYFLMGIFMYLIGALIEGAEFTLPFGDIWFIGPFIAFVITLILTLLVQVQVAKFIRPDSMALYYCLEPITTVIAAFFLLQEYLTLRVAIGGAIVIATILSTRRRRREEC